MSPEEYNNHNQVKSEVGFTAFRLNKKLDLGKFASDRTLVTNVAADLSTEPDAGLVRWQTLRKGRLLMIPRADERGDFMEWKGSPDWLLEIISKYSERKDTKLLREQYYKAEVSEYWLINARGRRIDFQILIWKPEGYVSAGTRAGWQFSPLFQHWFKLERKKDRIGLWEYTMHTKAK
jgi:Uma2 family endonuclease